MNESLPLLQFCKLEVLLRAILIFEFQMDAVKSRKHLIRPYPLGWRLRHGFLQHIEHHEINTRIYAYSD